MADPNQPVGIFAHATREENLKRERTCRYNHGPLEIQKGTWLFSGAKTGSEQFWAGLETKDLQYGVKIAKCPVCGYIELIDF